MTDKALKKLITVAKNGNKLSMGLQVVLAGKPNVGKSSLLNIISSSNRAIVNQQPGTTRDTIEVSIEIKGNPIKLIDTAGIREDADEIEREGIARTKDAIHFSDVVLFSFWFSWSFSFPFRNGGALLNYEAL